MQYLEVMSRFDVFVLDLRIHAQGQREATLDASKRNLFGEVE